MLSPLRHPHTSLELLWLDLSALIATWLSVRIATFCPLYFLWWLEKAHLSTAFISALNILVCLPIASKYIFLRPMPSAYHVISRCYNHRSQSCSVNCPVTISCSKLLNEMKGDFHVIPCLERISIFHWCRKPPPHSYSRPFWRSPSLLASVCEDGVEVIPEGLPAMPLDMSLLSTDNHANQSLNFVYLPNCCAEFSLFCPDYRPSHWHNYCSEYPKFYLRVAPHFFPDNRQGPRVFSICVS